jgi:putative transposase
MIERKPVQQKSASLNALEIGRHRCASFRRHIPLEGDVPAEAIRKVSEELGLSSRQVHRLVPLFRLSPVPDSLVPKRPGPKLGARRTKPEVIEAIDALIAELYLTKTPPAKALVAHQIRNVLIADNGDHRFPKKDVPSERVIERMIGEITETRKAKASKGSKSRTAFEAHPHHYQSNGILDLVQMDSTRADLVLVDQQLRAPLDRPWLTFLIDVFTRCIVGFYVSFGDPSIYRCGRAVVNAILPKEPLLAEMGLELAYPMHGLFARLHCDYAKPHRSHAFRSACIANGIDPDVRPLGPSHLGGHIERLIGTFVGKLKLIPGATGSNVTQRDGYDPSEAAIMTLPEFERWLVFQIAAYHNRRHAGLDGLSPAHAWALAMEGRRQDLPPTLNPERLMKQFLPGVEVQVHSFGIVIRRRKYFAAFLSDKIGLKVVVRIDERDLNVAYLEWEGDFIPLQATMSYPDVSEQEWEAARKQRRQFENGFQDAGAQAETARLVHQGRQEVLNATKRTRQVRNRLKRIEGEGRGYSNAKTPAPADSETQWVDPGVLGPSGWEVVEE